MHEFTCIFHRTDTKNRTACFTLCGLFVIYFFGRILYHEARSAVLLGLIEHAVGFSEQVLDFLRKNKAVRARCCQLTVTCSRIPEISRRNCVSRCSSWSGDRFISSITGKLGHRRYGPTKPQKRKVFCRCSANCLRTSSPTEWPYLSLMCLK